MRKSTLTVAIATALAAPVAAQAVDFTISGHVNRALVINNATDANGKDTSTAKVVNNGSSSTRIRWTGSSEMEDGNSVGIQVEYEEKGSGLNLRHANINYAGDFGKMTIGQGSEAGDGSAYRGGVGTFGIGHGQEKGSAKLGDYFGSLDAGTRGHMIRYDTPSIGPVGAAVSVGNGDRISAAATLSTEFSGSSFDAMVATLQEKGEPATIGASFGVSMASGLGISGAWAKGDDHVMGKKDGALDCTEATTLGACKFTPAAAGNVVDPSYFQAAVAYTFGDTTVAASWYSSEDFSNEGSEGTAIGVGVNHSLPKVRAQVYAAVQNYAVEDKAAGDKGLDTDETVFVVGTRVMF